MVYKKEFIAVVKCGGKILRELEDVVQIPFGSEYTLLLKNKSSRKAVVNVEIDGQDVLDGRRVIVDPNSDVELEGFLRCNIAKNRFKFIQKTDEIVEHRGDRVDDGLIRIEFRYEKAVKEVIRKEVIVNYDLRKPYNPWWQDYPRRWDDGTFYNSSSCMAKDAGLRSSTTTNMFMGSSVNCSYTANVAQDEGITVKGSEANQVFNNGYTKELSDNSEVIILRLRGVKGSKIVEKPLTVRDRRECPTCGRKMKSNVKYCSNCGTYLS